MSLTRRTSVLLNHELHERLVEEAERRGTSVGDVIRSACEAAYRVSPSSARVAAVRELTFLSLPLDPPPAKDAKPEPASASTSAPTTDPDGTRS